MTLFVHYFCQMFKTWDITAGVVFCVGLLSMFVSLMDHFLNVWGVTWVYTGFTETAFSMLKQSMHETSWVGFGLGYFLNLCGLIFLLWNNFFAGFYAVFQCTLFECILFLYLLLMILVVHSRVEEIVLVIVPIGLQLVCWSVGTLVAGFYGPQRTRWSVEATFFCSGAVLCGCVAFPVTVVEFEWGVGFLATAFGFGIIGVALAVYSMYLNNNHYSDKSEHERLLPNEIIYTL